MRIPLLLAVVFIVACSSGASKQAKEESNRKAAETNTALGRGYMERKQYEIALEKLKRAVAQDKTYAPAHTMLGVLYETIGERDLAEKEYELAVNYDPSDGDVNNNYGAFLCEIGKEDKAEKYFLTAVKDPFYTTQQVAWANAGHCLLQSGDLDKAEQYLRQSLEYDPTFAAALLPMADISYRKGSYLRARAFLQRYESVAAPNEDSLQLGYRIETELGDTDSAERYRTELMERFPSSDRTGKVAGRERE